MGDYNTLLRIICGYHMVIWHRVQVDVYCHEIMRLKRRRLYTDNLWKEVINDNMISPE